MIDVDDLFDRYATTEVTVVSGDLVPNAAAWLDQETYPSLEAASYAARTDPRHAGKVVQIILHFPGTVDRGLTREEVLAVLAPRREYHAAVKTGLRLAKDRIEPLVERIEAIVAEANGRNMLGSMRQYQDMQKACVATLREAGRIIVTTLVKKKGDNARNRRDELAAALEEVSTLVLKQFDAYDGSQTHSKPVAERADLAGQLERTVHRILLDFDEGVYQMGEDQKGGDTINIARIDQMAGHIGTGNSGNIRADLRINEAEVFKTLASALQGGVSNESERETLLRLVERMSEQRDTRPLFAAAYGEFVNLAANYMTIVAPFLPALTKYLTG